MGYDAKGMPEIVVAQPGGTFLTVDHTGKMTSNPLLTSATASSLSSLGAQTEVVCFNSNYFQKLPQEKMNLQKLGSLRNLKTVLSSPNAKAVPQLSQSPTPAASIPGQTFSSIPSFVRRFSSSSPPAAEPQQRLLSESSSTFLPSSVGAEDLRTLIPPTEPAAFFFITVEGGIKFQGQTSWQLQVEHQLFALSKTSISSAPKGDITVCSWDGLTFIVDANQNVVRFQYPNSVAAFAAGRFSTLPGVHKQCLIYVDYSDSIRVFYDLELDDLSSNTLLSLLQQDPRVRIPLCVFSSFFFYTFSLPLTLPTPPSVPFAVY